MEYNPEELVEILNIFKVESDEILQEINDCFLVLEKNSNDETSLKRLLQLFHSLKGSARMLGFTSIQNIAHKLEDILTDLKNDSSCINCNFQIFYDACDLLNELVIKSVEQKSDYSSGKVSELINNLDNIIENKEKEPSKISDEPRITENKLEIKKDTEKKSNNNIIIEKRTDIKAVLLELMFVLEKDNNLNQEDIEEFILVVMENLNQLKEIFEKTDYQNVTDKINSALKTLRTKNDNILELCKNNINDLRNEIYNINRDLDIKNVIKKEEPPKNSIEELSDTDLKNKNESNDIDITFDAVLKNLNKIKFESSCTTTFIENLEKSVSQSKNEKIINILSKCIELLKHLNENQSTADNDCYLALLQSIYWAKRVFHQETPENTYNYDYLIQRLNVAEEMIKITEISRNNSLTPLDTVNPSNILEEAGLENIKNKLKSIDIQEIKTLRVDTIKLDNLIAQTGELLVNGIKTREHVIELSRINNKLSQWGAVSKKVINYIKYLEKKGFFTEESDDNAFLFYKKIYGFFVDNISTINDIQNDFEKLFKIISEDDNKLHQNVMEIEHIAKGIRVLPLASIFHSFHRMIRDIANENNKKIDFIISGSDTTVDKKIIEEIKIPLVHILRNSVSHGIEPPEERIKNNKPETGVIKLCAKQTENNVVITIEDDGYGINLEKVKRTAVKKGLLTQEEVDSMPNEQVMKILFIPGFSTQESVDNLSGRGIGLDVVKTKITNLNGEISIDSVLNEGCKVSIKLPMSMSTIKTFVILVNDVKYAIPISSVKIIKNINKEDIIVKNGEKTILFEKHSIPIYSVSEIFGEKISQDNKNSFTVVIIENQDRQAAFIVDKLLGAQEVFHKKLIPPIIKIKNISGFTTLPTGEICFIINSVELMKNTVLNNYISDLDFNNQLIVENKSDKDIKLVILENESLPDGFLENIHSKFQNLSVFDNINSVYDYIKKNNTDILIVKINDKSDETYNLVNYIKNDENLNEIKVMALINSDTAEFNADFYVNINNYDLDTIMQWVINQ